MNNKNENGSHNSKNLARFLRNLYGKLHRSLDSSRFREMRWPLFDSCLQNNRERQNDFGLESNFWEGKFYNHL